MPWRLPTGVIPVTHAGARGYAFVVGMYKCTYRHMLHPAATRRRPCGVQPAGSIPKAIWFFFLLQRNVGYLAAWRDMGVVFSTLQRTVPSICMYELQFRFMQCEYGVQLAPSSGAWLLIPRLLGLCIKLWSLEATALHLSAWRWNS